MSDCPHCASQFTDGYRHGLGRAILAIENTRNNIRPTDTTDPAWSFAAAICAGTLGGVADALRAYSASITKAAIKSEGA